MENEINKAADILKSGGVILYPTDTVWGLGCDPTNKEAVEKIISLKGKDEGKGLIVIVGDERLLKRYVKEIPDVCYDLIDFSEDPITIVYPRGQYVADNVLGPEGTLAVRLIKDDFCRKLMNKTKFGLVSTSANHSGEPTATKLEDIPATIKDKVDYVVNLGSLSGGANPSKIIKIGLNSEIEIIRK